MVGVFDLIFGEIILKLNHAYTQISFYCLMYMKYQWFYLEK
jgi:hypothetical protein